MPSGRRSSEAGPRSERQGQRAEERGHRRHQDRPEAEKAGTVDGLGGGDLPCTRSASSAKSMITVVFFCTIPMRRMIPMIAITVSSVRVISRARSAPTPAEGSVERIVKRVNEALVEDAQHHVHRRERRQDQEELVRQRRAERQRGALEVRLKAWRQAEGLLLRIDRVDGFPERDARG